MRKNNFFQPLVAVSSIILCCDANAIIRTPDKTVEDLLQLTRTVFNGPNRSIGRVYYDKHEKGTCPAAIIKNNGTLIFSDRPEKISSIEFNNKQYPVISTIEIENFQFGCLVYCVVDRPFENALPLPLDEPPSFDPAHHNYLTGYGNNYDPITSKEIRTEPDVLKTVAINLLEDSENTFQTCFNFDSIGRINPHHLSCFFYSNNLNRNIQKLKYENLMILGFIPGSTFFIAKAYNRIERDEKNVPRFLKGNKYEKYEITRANGPDSKKIFIVDYVDNKTSSIPSHYIIKKEHLPQLETTQYESLGLTASDSESSFQLDYNKYQEEREKCKLQDPVGLAGPDDLGALVINSSAETSSRYLVGIACKVVSKDISKSFYGTKTTFLKISSLLPLIKQKTEEEDIPEGYTPLEVGTMRTHEDSDEVGTGHIDEDSDLGDSVAPILKPPIEMNSAISKDCVLIQPDMVLIRSRLQNHHPLKHFIIRGKRYKRIPHYRPLEVTLCNLDFKLVQLDSMVTNVDPIPMYRSPLITQTPEGTECFPTGDDGYDFPYVIIDSNTKTDDFPKVLSLIGFIGDNRQPQELTVEERTRLDSLVISKALAPAK